MLKNIRTYESDLQTKLTDSATDTDWNFILTKHDRKLRDFQSERLVHLIVTMSVCLFTLLSFFTSFFMQRLEIHLLTLILIILSAAYLYHYYRLENAIQALSKYSSQIEHKISP